MYLVSGNKPGESNALEVQIPCIIFFILAPVFVGIRIWSRIELRNGLGYDDWTIIVSLIFSLTVSGLMMASCAYGFGQHIHNLTPHNKKMTLKLFYVAQAFYKLTINLTKASILLLYLRIFVQKYFRILCKLMLVIVLSYMVATFAAAVFQCTPISRAWDKSVDGTCIDIPKNWYANAGFSIATDFIILVLPMPILYKSNIPKHQKTALMFVFALGGFVMITSIFRMTTLNFSSTSPDSTFDIASSLWTIVEENVSIICASLPMSRLLLSLLFPSIFPPSHNRNAKSHVYASKPHSHPNGNGTFVRSAAGKNDWTPSRGDDKDNMGFNLASVKARGLSGMDNTSEEYILPVREEMITGGEGVGGETKGGTIQKVTKFEITYDDAGSNDSVGGGPRRQASTRL